jgi:uncharacterized RDD family membrane protein YckC
MFTIIGTDGKEYGPVTAAHVIDWLRDGRANLQTKARLDRENVWKTLGDFAEFSRQATANPSVPPFLAAHPDSAAPAVAPAVADAIRWLRLPAALIDGILKALCYLPITVPLFRIMLAEALRGEEHTFAEMSQLTTKVVDDNLAHALPFFTGLVLLQFCLLAWRGQSVGKLLFGLRIVRFPDQAPAGVARAFLLRGTVPFVLEQIPLLGLLFWIVDSCFIFRADQRCLHDLIAGTTVVRTGTGA